MRIGHYSDIQIQLNEDIGYDLTSTILNNVVVKFHQEKVDGIVLAGDIFEVQNPKDSERELIYIHLVNLLKIPSLKFLAILAGNHDYLDKFKNKDFYSDTNPLDTITKIIGEIDPELSEKIIYLKHQKPYTVPHFNNVILYPYSLEDGKSNGNNIIKYAGEMDCNNLNITVHHDIVYEYVEETKLPLSDNKKAKLIHVNSDQFFTDIILGGDIHQYYIINGNEEYPNRKYFYTGNVFERNFGEGSYGIIRKSVTNKPSYIRGLNIHDFEGNTLLNTDKKDLEKLIGYLTIDINSTKLIQDLELKIINTLDAFQTGTFSNFIRFKLAQMYAPMEARLGQIVEDYFIRNEITSTLKIEFIYDKKSVTLDNDVVELMKLNTLKEDLESNNITQQEYELLKLVTIDNVDLETALNDLSIDLESTETTTKFNELLTKNDSIHNLLNDENVDDTLSNIVLNNKQIEELFKLKLDDLKPSIIKKIGTDSQAESIISEVFSKFKSEFNKVHQDSRQYRCVLTDISCNFFCGLGENIIPLNLNATTKIDGSNGVGKTTLYNMIRWVIKGLIFPHLKVNQMVKNTALIFDINDVNKDDLRVEMNFLVNSIPCKIVRTASRKWKSSATKNPELKSAVDWVSFVESIERNVTLYYGDEVYYGEKNVQPILDKWFDESLDTTMIIDKYTIPNMLNKGGGNLRDLVMEHLAPYLNKLEVNLKDIKEEYNVVKPKKNLTDISYELSDLRLDIKENKANLETKNSELNTLFDLINSNKEKISELNNYLINLGNVPELLNSKKQEINTLENNIEMLFLSNEKFNDLEEPKFDLEAPTKPDTISNLEFDINTIEIEVDKKRDEYKSLNDKYHDKKNQLIDSLRAEIYDLKSEKDNLYTPILNTLSNTEKQINDSVNNAEIEFNNYYSELFNEVKIKQNNIINDRDNINQKHNDLIKQKVEIDMSIDSSFCITCKRKYDEKDDKHIEENITKLESIKTQISETLDELNSIQKNVEKYSVNNPLIPYLDEPENSEKQTKLNGLKTKFEQLRLMLESPVYRSFIEFKNSVSNKDINTIHLDKLFESKLIDDSILDAINKITSIDLKITLKEETNVSNDTILLMIENDIQSVGDSGKKLKEKLDSLKARLKETNDMFTCELEKFQNELKSHNEALIEYNKSVAERATNYESINQFNKQLIVLNNDKINLENNLLPKFNEYNEAKVSLNQIISEYNIKYDDALDNIKAIEKELISLEYSEKDLVRLEQEYIDYLKNSIIFATYETMIKKLFKNDVFSYYKEFLNSTLSLLLEDSKFKLVWLEDGELYYSEVKGGKIINIPVIMVSGMQTIFLGLSLIFTLSLLNSKSSLNVMFIDEITGSLNNGKGLKHTENVIDYQTQFVQLLSKFKNKQIFIIDHVIDNLFEEESYEVVQTNEGSKYIKRDN